MSFYTVAVQRWPWPTYKKIQTVDHFWSPDHLRVTIVDLKGVATSFPRMDRRIMKVYGDYKTFKELKRGGRELDSADPAEHRPSATGTLEGDERAEDPVRGDAG